MSERANARRRFLEGTLLFGAVAASGCAKPGTESGAKSLSSTNLPSPTGSAAANTAAIIAQLTASGTVVLPAGVIEIEPELYLGIRKRIVGQGRESTTLRVAMPDSNGAALLLDQYCSIENLTLENSCANQTTSIGIASYTPTESNGWANGALKDCRVIGFGYGIGATLAKPSSLTVIRSQAFGTKIWNNLFENCGIPIKLGLGANALSILGNTFVGTSGSRNIFLSECYKPVIFGDNVFQGVAAGGLDIELSSCWAAEVDGYFEPACGIYADSCPGLEVSGILVGQSFGPASNNAFLRASAANNSYAYPLPIRSRVRNVTLDGLANGKYCVSNDANAETLTDNCVNRQDSWVINGSGSSSG